MKKLFMLVTLCICLLGFCPQPAQAADDVKFSSDASGFVLLTDVVPDAILEIRYYSTYNFVGDRIDGYLQPTALLTKEAAQALKAVTDTLFRSLPLNRLEAQHDVRNPASGRVMQKSGFVQEGILRGRILNKGEYVDTVLYALLRSDWESAQR